MSTSVYSINAPLEMLANKYIDWERKGISGEDKKKILPATKYNILVKAFNSSAVMLVIAAVSTLFAMHLAIVFGSLGLLTRSISENGLSKLTQPIHQEGVNWISNVGNSALRMIQGAPTPGEEILSQLGIQGSRNWNPDRVIFCGYSLWKNEITLP